MHPKREKWLTDALPDAFLITDIAARLLREKEGSKSASLAFVMDIQSAAYEFVKACVRPGETEDDLIKRFAPYS